MFEWIAGIIASLGYTGVALLAFLEHLFPPIPSELILPLAGYVAASGTLTVGLVVATATVGSLAGATAWFIVGRRIGEQRMRAWIDRHGRWLTLSGGDIDRASAWFHRRGTMAVLVGRMVPGVRTFVSLPAGFSGMSWLSFLVYSCIGTLAWTAALVFAGITLRQNYAVVADYVDVFTNVILLAFAALMIWRYLKCWRADRSSPVHAMAQQ